MTLTFRVDICVCVFFFFGLGGCELSVEDFGTSFRSCTGNRSHTSIRIRVFQQSCDISEQMSCLLIVGRKKQLANRTSCLNFRSS